ncbi:SDR family oxidoreductase [Rothia nasimurium]|uniref:SDR family oxidoreductase n=1 Tax=Rothia nasimurium TaxID=85336 RepID=UPI001F1C7A6A|nr:SDR family oxidoreductase [Rothia nasimurium]
MDLTNTTALVTGAASGIGAATARALVACGVHVYGLDLPAGIEKAGEVEGVTFLPGDVTDYAAVEAAFEQVGQDERPLRTVVNCAGIAPGARVLSKKGPHDPALFAKTVTINLNGTFNVLTAGAALMATQEPVEGTTGRGVIINTASIAAYEGQIGQIAYAASKGGVVALTLPAARDLASSGIRVNTIAPGIVDTPLMAGITEEFREELAKNVPFPQRLAAPAEYADLAVFIAEHDYINGETIRMDGALRMAPR